MNLLRVACSLAPALLCWLAVPSQDTSKRITPEQQHTRSARKALCIGNQAYRNQKSLINPIHDATDMANGLRMLGFETELLTDGTRSTMERAVDEFLRTIAPGDVALFYYSGHGFQLDSVNYLVPIEFAARNGADAQEHAISFDAIKTRLERTSADATIMVLDACRDNPFWSEASSLRGLALMEAGLGSYIAFAASPGKTASDNPTGWNGLFTKGLLQHLKEPTDVAELFRRVRRETTIDSSGAQVPYLHDQMIADFYLNGPAPAPSAAEVPNSSVSVEERTAKQLYQEGSCEPAADLLDRVVRRDPTNAFTQNALGLAYACLSMNRAAAERFSQAIESRPSYAAPYLNRGNLFLVAGQYRLAIEDFTWAIEQEPSNASFHSRRGQAFFELRQYEDAQTEFRKSTELDPSEANGYDGLGRVDHQMGRFDEALRQYNLAIACNRNFAAAYIDRARTRERMGDGVGAEADRRTASEISRNRRR